MAVRAGGAGKPARRFLRISIRLAMSFGLAWVIALFLELAIFSDTISDKIKRDHVTVNQPVYQKIEQYQAEVGGEIEARRKSLAGPRYQFARQQKEVYEAQRAAREAEIAELRAKRDDLRAMQTPLANDVTARREQARATVQGKRER